MTTVYHHTSAGPLPETFRTSREPMAFHQKLPAYAPTRLVETPSIAERLGLGRVLVKDESRRFGMPSFKLLGASWATYRALAEVLGAAPKWSDISELREACARLEPFALAAATDGNHGRAVARMAKLLGFDARIFVPEGTTAARIEAIESEGAVCAIVDGDYDATVARSAEEASENCLVIDDTSWPGYETVPRHVAEGYSTIFYEIAGQADETPDVVFVPLGVGALGAAATDYFKRHGSTTVVGVEPESCASVMASLRAGHIVTVAGPHPSMMAGLNCGTPSPVVFPTLLAGMDASVAISDTYVKEAMLTLAACDIVSGETGAAALAGLEAMMADGNEIGLDRSSAVLLISTEGATDPQAYERIVGHPPR